MTKLVVEVLDASDLMPKDGQGFANPFVEVAFEEQRQRTQTKPKDLNPYWNEKFFFNVNNPGDLPNKTIDCVVYHDQQGGHHRNFLGRVRIYGVSVPLSESEANIQRYPLDKRGLFSHIKGDIALKIYAFHDGNYHPPPPPSNAASSVETETTPLQEINTNTTNGKILEEDVFGDEKKKKKKKDKEVRIFHSIGTATGGPAAAPPPVSSGFGSEKEKAVPMNVMETTTRADFARAGPPPAMHMNIPKQNPEFLLVETSPPVAARMRYRVGDKTGSTYDLVEQMYYLYVNVVKARDLPVMDVSGSLDPYV